MNTTLHKLVSILCVGAIAATSTPRLRADGQPCANQSSGGTSEPPCDDCEEEGEDTEAACTSPEEGVNAFSAYSGNAHRTIVDLSIFGSVGKLPLRFVRHSNTRMAPMASSQGRFGRDTVWTHSYQWSLRDAGTYQDTGLPALRLGFPDGTDVIYVQGLTQPTTWYPPANARSVIAQNGDVFTLRTHTGELYNFLKKTNASSAVFYRLATCEDSAGNIYNFNYNTETDTLLRKVVDPSGRWLKFTYQNLGLYDQQTVNFASVSPDAVHGQWHDLEVTATTACRFLALYTSNNAQNDPPLPVGEVEFYSTWDESVPANRVKITGTPFGSDPYFAPDTTPAKAFDGNTGTYYRYEAMRNGHVGLDAGSAVAVKHIRYWIPSVAATPGAPNTAVPPVAAFQFLGLNQNPAANQAIIKVEGGIGASNAAVYGTVTYNYSPFDDLSGWFRWFRLDSATYPSDPTGQQTSYTYQQVHDFTRPILTQASDPRLRGTGTRIEYGFDKDTALGFLREERSRVTGAVIARTGSLSAHKPKVTYPGGPSGQRVVQYEHYLTNGNTKSKTDASGRTVTMTYANGNAGHLTGVTSTGQTVPTVFVPSPLGNRASIQHPDSGLEFWNRDDRERLLSHRLTGPVGFQEQLTTYERDVKGRVTRIVHPDGTDETLTYHIDGVEYFGQVCAHRMRNGGTERYTYDATGRRQTHTDAAERVTVFTYDGRDQIATATLLVPSGVNRTTSYEYNDRGQVTKVTYSDATLVRYEYDTYGSQTARIDELGHRWEATYDEFKRRLTVSEPPRAAGQPALTTTFEYHEPGGGGGGGCCGGGGGASGGNERPTRIILPSGKITAFTYDGGWRKATETVGFGTPEAATTTYNYDPSGDLAVVGDPRSKLWFFSYDARHRRISASSPLHQAEPNQHTTWWTYDVAGNKLTELRPDGGLTANTYDVMNRLVSTTNPKNETTVFAYGGTAWGDGTPGNPATFGDNLVRLTDARGKHYRFTYDLLDRKTSMIYPGGGSHEDWTYDVPGNVATYTTRAGQVKTCTYDLRNRDLTCDWNDTTKDFKKTYDPAGRVLTMANGTLSGSGASATLSGVVSALSYSYDDANNLLSETQDLESPVNLPPKTVTYARDADGNRASLTYPGATVVDYTYTARNQLKDVIADGLPPLATYTYDLAGNRTGKALENSTNTIYTYDDANRLVTVDHKNMGVTFQRFDYILNHVGNRTSRTESAPTGPAVTDSYSYDPVDQVAQVNYQHDTTLGTYGRKVDYIYDPAGNRQSVIEDPDGTGGDAPQTTPYTANDLNQYTSIDSLAIPTHDSNGNLTTLQAKVGDPVWTYQFDAQNRLISGTSNAGGSFTFAYDPRNRCIARTFGGAPTVYLFDMWNVIEDRSLSDSAIAKYVHGGRCDEILRATFEAGPVYHQHDGLGSVTGLTGGSGGLVERYSYDAYGAAAFYNNAWVPISSSSFANRFLFAGRELFPTGYDLRNRVYSPSIGRFVQPDPSGYGGSDQNLYRHTGNHQMNATDPFGLWVFQPEGEWTIDQQEALFDAYTSVRDTLPTMVSRVGELIAAAEGIGAECCFKAQLLRDLKKLQKTLNDMISKLANSTPMNMWLNDFKGEKGGRSRDGWFRKWIELDRNEGLNAITFFHELSHFSGTSDSTKASLNSAHYLENFFSNPSGFTAAGYSQQLIEDKGTKGCSDADKKWNQ